MSIGKYLSFEEARKKGLLDRFMKEHPSVADERFWPALEAAAKGTQSSQETSSEACHDSCNETQTPSDTSEGDA